MLRTSWKVRIKRGEKIQGETREERAGARGRNK